jgi:hypothetical protein
VFLAAGTAEAETERGTVERERGTAVLLTAAARLSSASQPSSSIHHLALPRRRDEPNGMPVYDPMAGKRERASAGERGVPFMIFDVCRPVVNDRGDSVNGKR